METENIQLAITSEPRSKPSGQQSRSSLLREWVTKFALNAGQALDSTALGVYEALWMEGFADLQDDVLEAAFRKTLRTAKYWPIKVADIREHVEHAKGNHAEEEASQKWQQVRDYIRLHYNPDIGSTSGPGISERTRRAIGAAGGLAYLSECDKDNLVFARERFIESYMRWEELKQDQYLLPEGEVKILLAEVAQRMALPAPKAAR